ncbi:MAG: hypothetical protein ACREUQ_14410 [Burkholderiales bacterium]
MGKRIRIALLLFVLATVAVGAWQARSRTTSWERALDVVVFPINGDQRSATADYIRSLSDGTFASIKTFMRREATRYGIRVFTPVDVYLGPQVASVPPSPPKGGSTLDVIAWSLKLRFWAWRNGQHPVLTPDVRVYAVFFDPAITRQVQHSVGLREGLIGIANVFAATHMAEENNVIVTHELLHTLGATDKYDPATRQPLYPDGFADPGQKPLYPQEFAEIMAGRIALSESTADTPRTLELALIGPRTAQEIRWRR